MRIPKTARARRVKSAGFTLMEVMMVVVILGILMGIALPGYQNAMQKGRRTDARDALLTVANRQEQFMLDRSSYTNDLTQLGYSVDPVISVEGHYSIDRVATADCAVDSDICYVLEATPVSGDPQEKDTRCTSFRVTWRGEKSAEGTTRDDCW